MTMQRGLLIVCVGILLWMSALQVQAAGRISSAPSTPLPLRFIQNRGQVLIADSKERSSVCYYASLGSLRVFFRPDGFSYVVPANALPVNIRDAHASLVADSLQPREYRFDVQFEGCRSAALPIGRDKRQDRSNFYQSLLPAPVLGVSSYNQIIYPNLYQGIDLKFYFRHGQLKYDFIVHPGANPTAIRLRIDGAELQPTNEGGIQMTTPFGTITEDAPFSYQIPRLATNEHKQIPSAFRLSTNKILSFDFPQGYSPAHDLIIDPSIIWATYFGGNEDDVPGDIVVNNKNNIIVCGYARSTNFPIKGGISFNKGAYDFTVSEFDADGNLRWSTYYGGDNVDFASGVDVDNNDNIFITGYSSSTLMVLDGYQTNNRGDFDAVLLKFNSDGQYLKGSYLGGGKGDFAYDISVDNAGNPTIVGRTLSSDFPVVAAYSSILAGDADVFVARWSGQTLALLWSTFYGGTQFEVAYAVSTDANNVIYFTGNTVSQNFPTTNGSMQPQYFPGAANASDAFIAAFSAGGSRIWCTYYGGEGSDEAKAVTVLRDNTIAVSGLSSSYLLAMYGSPAQPQNSGSTDGFLLVMQSNGKPLWSTFWGGNQPDEIRDIADDADGNIYIGGNTLSPDFPRRRSLLSALNPEQDVFLSCFSRSGAMKWSSLLGGKKTEDFSRLAVDARTNVYITGSTNGDFPVTTNAYQKTLVGTKNDYFIAKICPVTPFVAITPNDTVCEGTDIVLTADSGLTVQWSSGESTRSIIAKSTGTYWYTGSNPNLCTAYSDTVSVLIKPKISVQIKQTGPTKACEGDSVLLQSVVKNFKTYRWLDEQNTVIGTKDEVLVKKSGVYHVETIDSTGCNGSSTNVTITLNTKPDLSLVSSTPAVNKRVTICEGDTVTIGSTVAFAGYAWKNGTLQPSVRITANDTVYATIQDANGCVWGTDSIFVSIQKKLIPTITAPDSTCIGTVIIVKAAPELPGAQYIWDVAGGDILSKVDSSAISVRWTSNGKKTITLKVGGAVSCTETVSKTLSIEGALSGKIGIQNNDSLLCSGESITLIAPPGFKNYRWNTAEQSNRINVTSTGNYSVEFDNGTGCIGYDTVRISPKMKYSLSTRVIDYDTVEIDSVKMQRVVVYNSSRDTMQLSDALLDGRHYRIDSAQTPSQRRIAPGDSVAIYAVFAPKNVNEKTDTLNIVFTEPCPDSIRVILQGVGKGKPPIPILRLQVEDLTINPANKTAMIPVKVWLEPNVATLDLDTLLFGLSYNAAMLHIKGATNGGTVQTTIQPRPQHSIASIRIPVKQLAFAPQVVTEVIADILLGDVERDSLFIATADIRPDKRKIINTIGGELRYEGLCREGNTRLIAQGVKTLLLVTPNPANGDIHIQSAVSEKANVELRIYSVNGEVVWKDEWLSSPSMLREHTLDASAFPDGVYTLVLQTPSQLKSTPLLIVK